MTPARSAPTIAGLLQPNSLPCMRPHTKSGRLVRRRIAPTKSFPRLGARTSTGRAMNVSAMDTSAIGMLSQKFQRQLAYCVMAPPMTGPAARKSMGIPAYTAMALPRSPGAKLFTTKLALAGCMMAAPRPCNTRAATSCAPLSASPHHTLANANKITPARKTGTRPNASAARPPTATKLASTNTYALMTHCN